MCDIDLVSDQNILSIFNSESSYDG